MRERIIGSVLILVGLLVPACGGRGGSPPPGAAQNGVSTESAESTTIGSACDCPRLAVVASSESPDPGRVQYELGEADLEKIFSNRDLTYRGQWALAFLALDNELDPTGDYQISQGVRSEPTYPVDLVEGQLTGALFSPPPGIGAVGPPQPMLSLLYTIARSNKYGEPEVSLRADSIRAARFLAGDLATIPADVQRGVPHARYIASVSLVARGTLYGVLLAANPADIRLQPQDPMVEGNQRYDAAAHVTTLELTRFDLTNAALDVLRSVDAKGKESGLFDPRTEYSMNVIPKLLDLASARSIFGGPAAAGSPQDAIACKAFVTLVRLANRDFPNTRPLREMLISNIGALGGMGAATDTDLAFDQGLRHARFEAAQAAFALMGPADADEARYEAHALIEAALGYAKTTPDGTLTEPRQLGESIDAVKFFEANADAPTGEYRESVAAQVESDLQNFKDRRKRGIATVDEKTLLTAWSTEEADTTIAALPETPVCTTGNCASDYVKEKPTITDETWMTRPTIMLRPQRQFATETLDSALISQPVEVTLRSPDGGGSGQVTVTNERSGQSHPVALGAMQSLDPRAQDGDVLRLDTQGGIPVEVTVYTDTYQQTIARAQTSLNALYNVYLAELQDGGAVDDPPAVAAERGQAMRKKLHAIANARLIMNYEERPSDRFSMWPATRAAVGMEYLAFVQTDPAGWDSGHNTQNTQTFKGPDSRFPGVSYESYEESGMVNRAIELTQSQMSSVILRNLGQMSVGLYRSYVTASCFELQRIKLPLCPEDFWIMVVGTDATGTELSNNDRWLHGITLVYPLVLQGGQALATLQTYSGRQYVPPRSDVPPMPVGGEEGVASGGTGRRSVTISSDERDLPVGSATIQDSDFEWLDQDKTIPEAVLYSPPGFNRFSKPGKAISPGGNIIQIADNTCALNVFERIRREAGLPARTEATNVRLAYSRSRYVRGGGVAYTPDKGAYREGLILMYEAEGGRVLNVERKTINLKDIEQELGRRRSISAVIETQYGSATIEPVFHAIEIEQVTHLADGRVQIRYWDPWNGNEWTIDLCHFERRWWPRETIIVDMSKAYKRLQ